MPNYTSGPATQVLLDPDQFAALCYAVCVLVLFQVATLLYMVAGSRR